MGERLPGSMQAAAQAAYEMGITTEATTEQLFKAMENGKLMADEFLPVFSQKLLEAANNGGALEKAMQSTGAAFGRLRTNIFLANAAFNEAGFDKTLRDIFNTLSDSIQKAEPLWKMLGDASTLVGMALRGPIELFGSLAKTLGIVTDSSEETQARIKLLSGAVLLLFKRTRALLATFLLIPLAMSGISKIIDGEKLSWVEWAITIGGVAMALRGVLGVLKKIQGLRNKGVVAEAARGATSQGARGSAKTGHGRMPSMANDWDASRGSRAVGGIFERIKTALSNSFKGAGSRLPIMGLGVGSTMSESDFVRRSQETPWWDLKGRLDAAQSEQQRQMIVNGDIKFEVTGDNAEEISDQVIRVINENFIRPSSMNNPTTER